MVTKDLGLVTAYAYAVSKGYTGTEEEFAELMASYASVAQDAANAALSAAQSAQSAQSAQTAAEGAKDTAQATVSGAIAGIQAEGQTQIGAVQSEGTSQVGNVNSAGQTQIGNVNAAGATQVSNVNTAGSTQVSAIQAKGNQIIASLPEDYTEIRGQVSQLSDEIDALRTFTPAIIISSGFPDFTYENGTMSIVMPSDAQCILPQYGAYNSNIITLSNKTGTSQDTSGSLYYVLYNKQTQEIRFVHFRYINTITKNDIILGYASKLTKTFKGNIVQLYEETKTDFTAINYTRMSVFGIAHKGLSYSIPENTLPAIVEARKEGFRYAEFDVQWTSDNVPVILHDATLNRTCCNASDGSAIESTIYINDITYEALNAYDACTPNKWATYKGIKIPRFVDVLNVCRNTGLVPIIEIKLETANQTKVSELVDIVKQYGMIDVAHWLVTQQTGEMLLYVKTLVPNATLWYARWGEFDNESLGIYNSLKAANNKVYLMTNQSAQTAASINLMIENSVPYTNAESINTQQGFTDANPYMSAILTDRLLPEKVLYNSAIT